MPENTSNIKNYLTDIENVLKDFSLPKWDELPLIDLYMDQVIELISKYFSVLSAFTKEDKILTPPMINNYVKLKAMPAPKRKKYSTTHIAYLIMICSLKQTMRISSMDKIIPLKTNETEVREMYNSFLENQKKSFSFLYGVIKPIIDDNCSNISINDIMLQIIISTNFSKICTESMIEYLDKDEKSKKVCVADND